MTNRPKSNLELLAERLSEVLNRPIEEIDLRLIAEICWALDLTPTIELAPIQEIPPDS